MKRLNGKMKKVLSILLSTMLIMTTFLTMPMNRGLIVNGVINGATLSIETSQSSVTVGNSFTITVSIEGIDSTNQFDSLSIKIPYDTDLFTCNSVTTNSSFKTALGDNAIALNGKTNGIISLAASDPDNAITYNGDVLTASFTVKSEAKESNYQFTFNDETIIGNTHNKPSSISYTAVPITENVYIPLDGENTTVDDMTLAAFSSKAIVVNYMPTGYNTQNATISNCTSEDTSIATVTDNGTVTGVKAGTTYIDLNINDNSTDPSKSYTKKITVKVTKASAEQNAVTATPYSGTYDSKAHTITASATQTGSTLYYSTDNKTWSTTAPTWTNVTEAQTVYVKATNPNYEDSFVKSTVTITPKTVTVKANDNNKVYGEIDPVLDATVSGTLGSDSVTYTVSRATGENVGTYAITPAGETAQGNYSVTYATGTLTITKAPATENAVTAMPYNKEYDANAHSITASTAQSGSTVYYSTDNVTWSTTAPTWTNVTTAQTVYVKATNPNYEDSFGNATVTITAKPVTVTANDKSKIYNTADPSFDATVIGILGSDTVTYTFSRTTGENVGTYTITPAGEAVQGNYSVTYATGTLTITAASDNAVNATAYSGTYDAKAHTITAYATQTGSTLYYSTNNITWNTTAPTWTNVTTGQIVYVKATNPNYEDAFGQATVTIAAKSVTVEANDNSKVYGEIDPALNATVTGPLGSDTVTYTVNRETGEDSGTYAITPTGTNVQGNYFISFVSGTFTIKKAPSTDNVVTVTGYTGTYDAKEHPITASAAQTGSTLYYSKDNTTWSATKPTIVNVADSGTIYVKAVNNNYEDSFGSGTISITQANATVTADNISKKYGESDPELTATVDGTLGTDKLEYTLSRISGESVGTYVITPAGETNQGNYNVSFVPGIFTINEAPIKNISLDKTSSDVGIDKDIILNVSYDPAITTDPMDVTWSSSDESVATVTGSGTNNAVGTVTGVTSGTVTITATVGAHTATCAVTVKKQYSSISLDKTTYVFSEPGLTTTLAATVEPDDAEDSIVWTSSDESIATVDQNGVVTAKSAGKAVISATSKLDDKVTAQCNITVEEPVISVNGNTLSGDTLSIDVGSTDTFTVSGTSGTVKYSSSDPSIATIDDSGKLTAIKTGTTVITITDGNVTKNITVTVNAVKQNQQNNNNNSGSGKDNQSTNNVKTGDSTNNAILMIVLLISIIAAAAAIYLRYRNRHSYICRH
jgi:uncharacterized protein YjdB